MRGRLIFPFLAELRRLDTAAMATTDPDGAGALTGGFDPDFKEPVLVDRDGDGVAERERTELPAIRVPCQVEPKVFEDLRMLASGASPPSARSFRRCASPARSSPRCWRTCGCSPQATRRALT